MKPRALRQQLEQERVIRRSILRAGAPECKQSRRMNQQKHADAMARVDEEQTRGVDEADCHEKLQDQLRAWSERWSRLQAESAQTP